MSLSAVAIYALVLLVSPFVAWRRRRRSSYAAALAFIWISSAYVFVVANVSDLGENMRFRYDLGPLPLVAAAAAWVASRGLPTPALVVNGRVDGVGARQYFAAMALHVDPQPIVAGPLTKCESQRGQKDVIDAGIVSA